MGDESAERPFIHHKWGFGMAPPLPETQRVRMEACALLFQMIDARRRPSPEVDEPVLDGACHDRHRHLAGHADRTPDDLLDLRRAQPPAGGHRKLSELLDSLPDNLLLTVVDCHI